jgi:hypothetical protein
MHPILLLGAALVGLPILLHLIMKQEPKRLPFPAFRFLKQQLKTNQRKLRLRHFILLALRMLLIALFCLTLYQPMLQSEGLPIRGEQPLAVVLVIDTSPSMGYSANDRTRLEDARRRALELLDELPDRSQIAIVPTGLPASSEAAAGLAGAWLRSPADARKLLENLKEPAAGESLPAAIATAYQLLRTVDQETEAAEPLPRLVAVFTDRAAACWDPSRLDDLKKLRDGIPDPKPMHAVFDVGVDQPTNVAILSAEMKPQIIPSSQPAVVSVTVGAVGPDVEAVVAARLAGPVERVEKKPVPVPGGQTRAVTFDFRNLTPGLYQVEFKLESPDRLAFDNFRYLTFRVAEPRKILTIADNPDDATYWKYAHESKGDFDCTVVRPDEVKAADLPKYEIVCLLSVARPNAPPGNPLWDKLVTYVEGGGKLVVMPGGEDQVVIGEYDPGTVPEANKLMPGTLKGVISTRDTQPEPPKPADPKGPRPPDRREGVTWLLDDRVIQHPMLTPFKAWLRSPTINFIRYPRKAWKYWDVEKLTGEGISVVVEYDDSDDPKAKPRHPAVLERNVGSRGKVLLLTTRMDKPSTEPERQWNDYWQTDISWDVVFPWLIARYLAGDTEDANFNYLTGQSVTVPITKLLAGKRENLVIEHPSIVGSDAIIKPAERQAELRLGPQRTSVPGNFKLRGPNPDWQEGFGLNVPAEESNLEKVPVEAIEDLTGKDTVVPVGKDVRLRDLLTEVGPLKQPLDLFPWLLIAVLMLLVVEALVANRFYRRPK